MQTRKRQKKVVGSPRDQSSGEHHRRAPELVDARSVATSDEVVDVPMRRGPLGDPNHLSDSRRRHSHRDTHRGVLGRILGHFWQRTRSSLRPDGEGSANSRRVLEGIPATRSPVVLQNDPNVPRARRKGVWHRNNETTERGGVVIAEPEIMSVFTLPPNHNRWFSFNVPANGKITYEVESEQPTGVLVLDQVGINTWTSGKPASGYGPYVTTTKHYQQLVLPFRGPWYLVIANFTGQQTAVHYNVWS
jgi:hypothetical protein